MKGYLHLSKANGSVAAVRQYGRYRPRRSVRLATSSFFVPLPNRLLIRPAPLCPAWYLLLGDKEFCTCLKICLPKPGALTR